KTTLILFKCSCVIIIKRFSFMVEIVIEMNAVNFILINNFHNGIYYPLLSFRYTWIYDIHTIIGSFNPFRMSVENTLWQCLKLINHGIIYCSGSTIWIKPCMQLYATL